MVLLNVMNDRNGDEVSYTHLTPQEKPDLCAADIILNELLDDMDVIFPGLQASKGFIDICATALNNEGLVKVLAAHFLGKNYYSNKLTPYLPKI